MGASSDPNKNFQNLIGCKIMGLRKVSLCLIDTFKTAIIYGKSIFIYNIVEMLIEFAL